MTASAGAVDSLTFTWDDGTTQLQTCQFTQESATILDILPSASHLASSAVILLGSRNQGQTGVLIKVDFTNYDIRECKYTPLTSSLLYFLISHIPPCKVLDLVILWKT